MFRLLICYALVNLQKNDLNDNSETNFNENFFIFVPMYFTNFSVKSLKDFWFNEEKIQDICDQEKLFEKVLSTNFIKVIFNNVIYIFFCQLFV